MQSGYSVVDLPRIYTLVMLDFCPIYFHALATSLIRCQRIKWNNTRSYLPWSMSYTYILRSDKFKK